MAKPVLPLFGLLLLGVPACSPAPESPARAQDRVMLYVSLTGGSAQFDENDPEWPVVGLSLERTLLMDAALVRVGQLTTLRKLSLANSTRITERGLSYLQGLVNLRELDLRESEVSDRGVEHLGRLTGLRSLNLAGNPAVSDAGLRHLGQLADLRELDVRNTAVTEQGVTEIRRGLPRLRVVR